MPINKNKNDMFPGPAFGGDPIIIELLREAIDNELTELQRRTVHAVWYGGKRVCEVARLEQIKEQTVRKRLQQSYSKLHTALRYAVRYSQLRSMSEDAIY